MQYLVNIAANTVFSAIQFIALCLVDLDVYSLYICMFVGRGLTADSADRNLRTSRFLLELFHTQQKNNVFRLGLFPRRRVPKDQSVRADLFLRTRQC
jgi:hypothetical protein